MKTEEPKPYTVAERPESKITVSHLPIRVIPAGVANSDGEFLGLVTGYGLYTQEVDDGVLEVVPPKLSRKQAEFIAWAVTKAVSEDEK